VRIENLKGRGAKALSYPTKVKKGGGVKRRGEENGKEAQTGRTLEAYGK